MTAELKARLREIAAKRRGRLLKDVDPFTLCVFVDHFEETSPHFYNPLGRGWAYLKYATAEQVEAFRERMALLETSCGAAPGSLAREVVVYTLTNRRAGTTTEVRKTVFPVSVVRHVLGELTDSPDKYYARHRM